MLCNHCGAQLKEGAAFCSACGNAVQTQTAQQPDCQQPDYLYFPAAATPEMPMKWYKFLIYFSLFAGAVINFLTGLQMATGTIYGNDAALVYEAFAALQGFDIFMGLFLVALAGYAVFVRFQLSSYKKTASMLLLGLYIGNIAFNLIYAIGLGVILSAEIFAYMDMTSYYSGVVSGAVMAVVNYIYFKKRAHLFVN